MSNNIRDLSIPAHIMDTIDDFVDKMDQMCYPSPANLVYAMLDEVLEKVFEEGWNDGYDSGYDSGHDDGHEVGHEEGYDEGYEQGLADAAEDP